MLDVNFQIEQAKKKLRGERLTDLEANNQEAPNKLTNFVVDLSVDGVQLFNNSEQSECIPICMVVRSVSESHDPVSKPFLLTTRSPIIIGVAHCKEKPPVNAFMKPLMEELAQLNPFNCDADATTGREFTVSVRCVIADWPMRSYLKRVKGHSGYWSCERCIQAVELCEVHCGSENSRKMKSI